MTGRTRIYELEGSKWRVKEQFDRDADGRIDLGWANGWKGIPAIVQKCRELGHKESSGSGRWSCTSSYGCQECNYVYMVDSSG